MKISSTPLLILIFMVSVASSSTAQITLTGTDYTQNFNSLSGGLPNGWTVYTSATSTSLGTSTGFQSNAISWSASVTTEPLNFRNISSSNIDSGSNASTQELNFDRALGWRPGNAASREGAVTFAIANTLEFENFNVGITLFSPNNVSNDQTYVFEYRVGDTGAFTQLGATYTTGTVFGQSTITANSITLSAINNQSSIVYFRVRGTTSSGTSSSGLDVLGIDNFSLSYNAVAVPEPSTYAAILGGVALVGVIALRRRKTAAKVA